jgi:PAS domain S-box-containing protein
VPRAPWTADGAETPDTPTQQEAQDGLRRALRDPTLELAFWLPERRAYVNAHGRPFTTPEGDARVSTPIAFDAEPLALVVHDAALSEEPEVLSAVLSAAKLELQKDRLQAQLCARVDELQRERDFVATVVNVAPAFFCVLGAAGRIERFNTTLEQMSGRLDDTVRGRAFWEVFPVAGAATDVRTAIESRAEGELEHEWMAADGDSRVVSWRLTPLPENKLLVSGVDVTERSRADENIRLHVQLLSDLADASPALLVVVNLDGRHNDDSMNQAAKEAFGYEPAELDRRFFWDVWVPEEDRAAAEAAIRAAVAGEPPKERESYWLTKHGEPRLVTWSCALMPDVGIRDRIVAINGIDVTERRRMLDEQAALRRVATLVAEDPPFAELLVAVTSEVGPVFRGDNAQLVQLDGDAAIIVGEWFDDPTAARSLGLRYVPDENRLVARVRRTGAAARRDSDDCDDRGAVAAPISIGGRPWGVIVVGGVVNSFPAGIERRLDEFAQLVAQAIANAQDREEVRASRARIVEAGDAARKRLERNLHDGAQQRLVSLSLALRLAQAKVESDPVAASEILSSSAVELAFALEELRELASGLHPAILTDRGLAAALDGLAERSRVPVELTVMLDKRLPESVEAALFYVAAESLTNVAKYAGAQVARVRVAMTAESAVIEVEDDGVGGVDPAAGSGIRGLMDRVEALDGRLSVQDAPGGGTLVRAEIPVSRPATPAVVA